MALPLCGELDFSDYQDFFDSARGFLKELDDNIMKGEETVWNTKRYQGLLGSPLRCPDITIANDSSEKFVERIKQQMDCCPTTVHKSLWRQALLNNMHGLFEVCVGVYQIRGYDLANLTIVETCKGIVVIDCLTACESAKEAMNLYWEAVNAQLPVKAIILTHSHVDHYGGTQGVIDANEERFGKSKIQIIAPLHFLEEAALENAIAGDAMSRRSTYQYAMFLPVVLNGTGKVDEGLGKDIQQGGTISFVTPDCTIIPYSAGSSQLDLSSGYAYEKMPMRIDDVDFELMLCSDTEAPSEMTVWIGKYKTLVAAEIAVHTLHNLLTPRGAQVRDARLWRKALDELIIAYQSELMVVCATHHWPVWQDGRERSIIFLKEQRDSYQYLHDQTVRLMNKGYTMLEIADWFDEAENLPCYLKEIWHNRGYYGTISHNVRAVYQKYLGWFDMNPSNLNPLPPESVAKRYIQAMGGNDVVFDRIECILKRSDSSREELRWVAEIGKHLVFALPNNQNRCLLAQIYEKLGYCCEAGTWRNIYLVGAEELRKGTPLYTGTSSAANPAILSCVEDSMLYDFIASRFIAENAFSPTPLFHFQIHDPDSNSVYAVEAVNGILKYEKRSMEELSPKMPILIAVRSVFVSLILKSVELKKEVETGSAVVYGEGGIINHPDDMAYVNRLFDCIEGASSAFQIVMP